MCLDFSEDGVCHVSQKDHVLDIIETLSEKFKEDNYVLTPASIDLFEIGGGELLSSHDQELFHNVVAKGIFVSSRSRPDITPTISILSGRVRSPNRSDWEKCRRFVRYLC